MYEYVAEERTVKMLALIGVLAVVGMVVMPVATSADSADAVGWATYFGYIGEADGISITTGLTDASIYAGATGAFPVSAGLGVASL